MIFIKTKNYLFIKSNSWLAKHNIYFYCDLQLRADNEYKQFRQLPRAYSMPKYQVQGGRGTETTI